jgi:hypothetical protein
MIPQQPKHSLPIVTGAFSSYDTAPVPVFKGLPSLPKQLTTGAKDGTSAENLLIYISIWLTFKWQDTTSSTHN